MSKLSKAAEEVLAYHKGLEGNKPARAGVLLGRSPAFTGDADLDLAYEELREAGLIVIAHGAIGRAITEEGERQHKTVYRLK